MQIITNKPDDGRQHRRQSKDFGEIVNTHTDMQTSAKHWAETFHNKQNPLQCQRRNKIPGCLVCEHLDEKGWYQYSSGEIESWNLNFIGDVHGALFELSEHITSHPHVSNFIGVGDVSVFATDDAAKQDKKALAKISNIIRKYINMAIHDKKFLEMPKPFETIFGNHDDYEHMYGDIFTQSNIVYLKNGTIRCINGVWFAFLGGIYSPIRSAKKRDELVDRERRFFTIDEIETIRNFEVPIDVLVTHEAAAGVIPGDNKEGQPIIRSLVNDLKPKIYIHGHHHLNYQTTIEHKTGEITTVYGLGNFSKNPNSYITLNLLTKKVVKENN